MVGRPVVGNEEIVAFVQLLKGSSATAQDVMAHVAPELTSYKRPSEIILMDALPHSRPRQHHPQTRQLLVRALAAVVSP